MEPPQQAPETFNRVGRREFCASSAMSYAWLSTGLQWLQRRGRSGRSLASLLAIVAVSDLIFHISSFIGGVAQGQVIARLALCSKDFFQAVRQLAPLPLLEIRRAINLSHLRWMILKGGPCVQTIDASHTDDLHVTDDILALIAEKCQGVLEVSLTENKRISNAGLVSLCQGCSALQQITLRGLWISDMGLIVASPHLGCLTHIDLMNCSSVTDIGVAAIAEYCHLLTSVDLSHIVEITDASIRALAGHCQRLEHICAVRCARIGDSSCLSLGEGECRRSLRSVNFSRTGITDHGVTFLADRVVNLSSIDITHNDRITDVSVAALSLLEGLSSLRISWCAQVTDASVALVAARCTRLDELHVRDCFLVTEVSLNLVRLHRPHCDIFDF